MSDLALTTLTGVPLRAFPRSARAIRGSGDRLESAERVKRIRDLAACLALGPIALLLTLVLAAFVRMETRGPVFVTLQRSGRGGRPFRMHRFRTRTMVEGSAGGSWVDIRGGARGDGAAAANGSRTSVGATETPLSHVSTLLAPICVCPWKSPADPDTRTRSPTSTWSRVLLNTKMPSDVAGSPSPAASWM